MQKEPVGGLQGDVTGAQVSPEGQKTI